MKKERKQLYVSILLALAALVSVVTVSVAWFTIADYTKVYSMGLEVTSGTNLRFDLVAHDNFEEYVKTLSFAKIADSIRKRDGFDPRTKGLEPVTTKDYVTFTYKDGSISDRQKGDYLEFTLHFFATEEMLVHLTSAGMDHRTKDGTKVESSVETLPQCMRISFTVDGNTYVYHPGLKDSLKKDGKVRTFGLPGEEDMVLNDNNSMFWLKKMEDKPVVVRIWLEGSDPACTDELRNADYRIQLRFIGTDREHHILDGR